MRKAVSRVAIGVLLAGMAIAGPASSAYAVDGITAGEVQSALGTVPQLVASSASVTSTSDADSAAITNVNGTQVDVPKNQAGNVHITTASGGCGHINVQLPSVAGSQNGSVTAPGIVSFPSGDDFANAVQADNVGGVRFAVVLDGPDAPEDFTYTLDLPNGSSIVREVDGSLTVTTPSGVCAIAPSWAYDATGKKVWTQFFTDGESTIDLVVNHWGENVTYPITADPRWVQGTWYGAYIIHYTRDETRRLKDGLTLAGIIGGKWWYVGIPFGLAGWWVTSVYDSGRCIVAHVWPGMPWATWAWAENC